MKNRKKQHKKLTLNIAKVISIFLNNFAAILGPPGKLETKLFNIIAGERGPTRSSITMDENTEKK